MRRPRLLQLLACAVTAAALGTACAQTPRTEPAAAPATLDAAAASLERLAAQVPESTLPAGFDAWSAAVVSTVTARSEPDPAAASMGDFEASNGYGDQQVFRVLEERRTPSGLWYHVLLPIEPNGARGWVPAQAVVVKGETQRLVVRLGARTLHRIVSGKEVGHWSVGIGKPQTPTPPGPSYLWAKMTREQGSPPVYGAGVLALAAMSPTLSDWQGSSPRIGIHGTSRPTDLGNQVSHGCVRMTNDELTVLLREVPVGTPIDVEV